MKLKASYQTLNVYVDTVKYGRQRESLAGVTFTLEALAGHSRSTLTRAGVGTVLAGPFGALLGVAARKHVAGPSFIVVTGPTFQWRVKVEKGHEVRAERFLSMANTAALKFQQQSRQSSGDAPVG